MDLARLECRRFSCSEIAPVYAVAVMMADHRAKMGILAVLLRTVARA